MTGDPVLFTFDWYRNLLDRLQAEGYSFEGYDADPSEGSVFLRHDVDWSPRKARKMAEIEAELGVKATYFFLVSTPFYNVMHEDVMDAVVTIEEHGHNVGLHFSTHNYFDEEPRENVLAEKVEAEFDVLDNCRRSRDQFLSFHNPPDWVLDRTFGPFTSAYEPIYFSQISYQADSSQRWKEENFFQNGLPESMQLLTHPVLWGERDAWSVDRLREERDYHEARIEDFMNETDRNWANHVLGTNEP